MNPLAAPRATPPIDWSGVPVAARVKYMGRVSAVCTSSQQAEDLVKFFGHPDFCPLLPVLLIIPGAPTPTAIEGRGYAPAAELRDIAVHAFGRTAERLAENNGQMFDFDALRERAGLMRREDVDAATREAMWDRAKRHRTNSRTDPTSDPMRDTYPRKSFGVSDD